jgi:hypothetical protein
MEVHMRFQVPLLALLITLATTMGDADHASLLLAPAHAAPSPVPQPSEELPSYALLSQPTETHHLAHVIQRMVSGGAVLHMREGATFDESGGFDLVIHFHGGAPILEPMFDELGLDAALLTVNLGAGSRQYVARLAGPGALDRYIEGVLTLVRQQQPNAKVRRLALSAWSAGYGAVFGVLKHEANLSRIDAVLLADGLHGGFIDKRRRVIAEPLMAPFEAFAKRAIDGKALMIVTHSQVNTYSYASTTETTSHLIEALDVDETCTHVTPAAMRMKRCKMRGNFKVVGYAGNDKAAHSAHVRQIDELLWAALAARWS